MWHVPAPLVALGVDLAAVRGVRRVGRDHDKEAARGGVVRDGGDLQLLERGVALVDRAVVDPQEERRRLDVLLGAELLARRADGAEVHIVWVGRLLREPLMRATAERTGDHERAGDRMIHRKVVGSSGGGAPDG